MSERHSYAKSGARNPRAKLTQRDVNEIRERAEYPNKKRGWKSAMAREFGITPSAIGDILSGRRW